jgi:ABC-2 type transport system ATP-binding protein
MLEMHNVTRKYGDKTAVEGVSLSISPGEVVGLLGHNGAGKTTLMKMLTGYLEPTSGQLSVCGIDVLDDRIGAQTQIGYLPEHAPIYEEMLVQEYLLTMAALRGVSSDHAVAAVARAVRATGLEDRLVQPIRHLSKGFRQRVGIAQAIVHDPAVLVLDEPTNGLDPVQIQAIRELIRELANHTTILLSTHILQEVEAVCDRVVVLIEGKVAADAPLRDLLTSHRAWLSLGEGAEGVSTTLKGQAGVVDVQALGPDPQLPGHTRWELTGANGLPDLPRVVELVIAAGWSMGAACPVSETLDGVFRRLQREHIAQAEAS